MARLLTTPRDPEAVALAALALRHYVTPSAAPSKFETETAATLKQLGTSKTAAKRMLENFGQIRASDRRQRLGDLGVATEVPKRIRLRSTSALVPDRIVLPRVLLSRRIDPIGGGATHLPPGAEILAPIDYTIAYEGMHCIDETHADWAGSDTIYIVISAVHIDPQGANVVRTERVPINQGNSGTYDDVDSHDTRVGPRSAVWKGIVGQVEQGMSLTTVVFEHDFGDPDHFREEVDAAVKLAIALATYLYPPAGAILALIEASGLVTDFFNWLLGTGDDEIGTATSVLELADLEDYSRTPKSEYRESQSSARRTGLMYHFLGSVNDNDYVAAYTVTRNPRAPLFEPVVE